MQNIILSKSNKHIKGTQGDWSENKWKLGINNLDIYLGLAYTTKKMVFTIEYRIMDYQKIDRVIFNYILFSRTSIETP